MELSGTWRAAIADEELRRTFAEPDVDDGGWETIEVPSHWRSHPAFHDTDGPLLYRTRFDSPQPGDPERRWWLVLDGLFYQGDVWFDGAYLGDVEGYFFPHALEITEPLAARSEHLLAVEVSCAPQPDRTDRRNLTGTFQHSSYVDTSWNPGGLWRPVRLESSGAVRIKAIRVLCQEANAERALVTVRATLDTVEPRKVQVRTTVAGVEHLVSHPLAAGENQVAWTVAVPEPELWWPRALGDQPLHDVDVEVLLDGERSDHQRRRIGFRQLALRNWICSVNGERLFLKGANQGPLRQELGEVDPARLASDVRLATDAGLDLLRIHGHVSRPELYDAADEAGLLLWQDLPLHWGYGRGVRKQAVQQARAAVDLLGHHPSVAIWCGHNEPSPLHDEPSPANVIPSQINRRRARPGLRRFAGQELPTWNRTVLDRSVKRALEKADPSRPVIAHSGVWPHPPQLDGTASHLYFGWYHGELTDLEALAARLPRMVRFVSEFGAQAVPNEAKFCEPDRWPNLDWEHLQRHHCLQKEVFDRVVPPADYPSFEAWQHATQQYQALLIKHHVETLRRLKYRPTGGFAVFSFADATAAISWSVLDHERSPKAGYEALVAACQPVVVVADPLPPTVLAGDHVSVDVHVVSDRRSPIEAGLVTAQLTWPGGEHAWRWAGEIPADRCILVGTVTCAIPDGTPAGAVELELRVTADGVDVGNRYRSWLP